MKTNNSEKYKMWFQTSYRERCFTVIKEKQYEWGCEYAGNRVVKLIEVSLVSMSSTIRAMTARYPYKMNKGFKLVAINSNVLKYESTME